MYISLDCDCRQQIIDLAPNVLIRMLNLVEKKLMTSCNWIANEAVFRPLMKLRFSVLRYLKIKPVNNHVTYIFCFMCAPPVDADRLNADRTRRGRLAESRQACNRQ